MPDTASIAEQQAVEALLRQLKSLGDLRRLLADLNYGVGDEPVSVADWKPELVETAKNGHLRTVARHQDFVITHCRLEELRVGPEREIVTRLVRQYDHGLFVFSDLAELHWHLVNVKRDSRQHNRLVLRRIAIGPEEQLRTAIERISLLKIKEASWSGLEVELKHEEAFDVEKVTDQFYWDYKGIFDHIVGRLNNEANLRTARAFVQQFMNRMMFLYFLQKKGWLDGRRDFVPWLWQKYQENPSTEDNFYKRYLDPLFFLGFTSPSDDLTPSVPKQQLYARQDIPEEIKQVFLRLPFLNGGLFSKIDGVDDQGLKILDSEFENLFEDLLEHYNFTVSEATPLNVEVAVNPEMLGKVYENLVLEEERGQAGIFYTPRVELDFMCRRALIEYLDEESIVDRPDLIRLVMNADTPEFVPDFPPERLREISRKLEEVTVVDPACGSGAFLIGMMQVLSGLHRLICNRLREPYHDFQVKKRIIGENLFGVDIKDWAVRVAELRLWLSLIINASLDEVQEEPGRAILPNLTFRLQAGDSLVEEIAGRSLSLRGRYNQMSADVRRQVNRLVDRKMDYYYNRGEVMPFQEIRRLETEVFQVILNDEVGQIDRELRRLRAQEQEGFQRELDIAKAGGPARAGRTQISPEKARLRRCIEELESERAEIIAVRSSKDIERGKGHFLWDIEFAEVFQNKGGFDIVIGNPPYVEYKSIVPLDKDPHEYSAIQWRQEVQKYKEALRRSLVTQWGKNTTIRGFSDYYVYFYMHGLALLRQGGSFCFVTSNFWLDVDYGTDLQRFLLTNIEINAIYENQVERTFAADINTVIVVFSRPEHDKILSEHVARFVSFQTPFEQCLTDENLSLIEWVDSRQATPDLRVYPISQGDLWRGGVELAQSLEPRLDLGFGYGNYAGEKWGGRYLRAPEIFLRILEDGAICRLGSIAEIATGLKEAGYSSYIVKMPARSGTHFGLLKNPSVHRNIDIASTDSAISLKEHLDIVEKARQKTSPILWLAMRGDRHICYRNPSLFSFTGNFFGINSIEVDPELLLAILNCTYTCLAAEVYGRKGFGGGASILVKTDLEKLPLPNPRSLTAKQKAQLLRAFNQMKKREIKSVFEELGLGKPKNNFSNIRVEDIAVDKVLPDRQELDSAILSALGLTERDGLELYRAVTALLMNRLRKAATK